MRCVGPVCTNIVRAYGEDIRCMVVYDHVLNGWGARKIAECLLVSEGLGDGWRLCTEHGTDIQGHMEYSYET